MSAKTVTFFYESHLPVTFLNAQMSFLIVFYTRFVIGTNRAYRVP